MPGRGSRPARPVAARAGNGAGVRAGVAASSATFVAMIDYPVELLHRAMSTSRTGADTESALESVGAHVGTGRTCRDVDELEVATAVAALAPGTRFARCWRDLSRWAVTG